MRETNWIKNKQPKRRFISFANYKSSFLLFYCCLIFWKIFICKNFSQFNLRWDEGRDEGFIFLCKGKGGIIKERKYLKRWLRILNRNFLFFLLRFQNVRRRRIYLLRSDFFLRLRLILLLFASFNYLFLKNSLNSDQFFRK